MSRLFKVLPPTGDIRGTYHYEVARPGLRIGLNRYGWKVIGAYVVVGRYAYCAKWAKA